MNLVARALSRGCGPLLENAPITCDKSVDVYELFPNTSPVAHQIRASAGKRGIARGWPNLSYAAAIPVHPQSTALTTVTSQFKNIKEEQPERTLW